MLKIILYLVLGIVGLFIVVCIGAMAFMMKDQHKIKALQFKNLKLDDKSDGSYKGSFSAGRFSNEVEVVVKDHKIAKINEIKSVTFIKPGWTDQVFNQVVAKQGLHIDGVSGATVTTKAYLKAIENALN